MSTPDPTVAGPCVRCARGLSLMDWPAVVRATFLLAAVSVAIRVLPFGAITRWALGARATGRARCPGCASRALTAGAVLLGRRPTCLARAIVLAHLLRQRGRDARVVIGVARRGGFAAHAWVEDDGCAVGDGAATGDRFAALERAGSRGAEGPI